MNFCLMGSLTFSEMQLSCRICGKYLRHVQGPLIGNSLLCAMGIDEFIQQYSYIYIWICIFFFYVKHT